MTSSKYWVPALAVLVVAFVGLVVGLSWRATRGEQAACEAQGRFYWRGHCLPSECSVVRP